MARKKKHNGTPSKKALPVVTLPSVKKVPCERNFELEWKLDPPMMASLTLDGWCSPCDICLVKKCDVSKHCRHPDGRICNVLFASDPATVMARNSNFGVKQATFFCLSVCQHVSACPNAELSHKGHTTHPNVATAKGTCFTVQCTRLWWLHVFLVFWFFSQFLTSFSWPPPRLPQHSGA